MRETLSKATTGNASSIVGKKAGVYAILLFSVTVIIFPLLWMVSTALKNSQEVREFPPSVLPSQPTVQPAIDALASGPWVQWFLNTLLIAGGAVLLALLVTVPAAYALARWDFFGDKVMYLTVMGLLMVPTQILLLPIFIQFVWINFPSDYLALIISYTVLFSAFVTFLLLGFFKTLPSDVEDAARIAGISEVKIFTRIILPLAKPAIGLAGIFVFIYSWNEYLWALVFLDSQNQYTISIGLTIFQGTRGSVVMNQLMAMSILASLPILVLFVLTQEEFIEGITTGFEF